MMSNFETNTNQESFWHGDVILHKCLPVDNLEMEQPSEKGYILAEGEITGHMHRILEIGKVEMFHKNGKRYLRVYELVDLLHEEHGKILIPPGFYEIETVKEYDPWEKYIRRVKD